MRYSIEDEHRERVKQRIAAVQEADDALYSAQSATNDSTNTAGPESCCPPPSRGEEVPISLEATPKPPSETVESPKAVVAIPNSSTTAHSLRSMKMSSHGPKGTTIPKTHRLSNNVRIIIARPSQRGVSTWLKSTFGAAQRKISSLFRAITSSNAHVS